MTCGTGEWGATVGAIRGIGVMGILGKVDPPIGRPGWIFPGVIPIGLGIGMNRVPPGKPGRKYP